MNYTCKLPLLKGVTGDNLLHLCTLGDYREVTSHLIIFCP